MNSQQKEDEKYMCAALDEAHKALLRREVPIGAVIVCGGVIISRGHNLVETLGDVTAHAEMQAITSAANRIGGKYLNECTLYVTVEPCVMCAGACAWSHLKRVVYGASDPKKGYTTLGGAALLHPKTVVASGILEEECRNIMESFFKKIRV